MREKRAGGQPGVDRLRKLGWNSNNVGSRLTRYCDVAIFPLRAVSAGGGS